jgi:tRNA 2-thiouridine synthesizing protein A
MNDDLGPDLRRHVLDLRGLKCPLPVLHTRKTLRRLPRGAALEVLCTDPLAGIDVPNLVRESGDVLLAADRRGPAWRFVIRKA